MEGRCIFCGEMGVLSPEHPLSKPVLDLAGFGWDDVSLLLDVPVSELTVEYVADRMRTIGDEVVRCVCTSCNNTWMQELDHSFAGTVKRWVTNPTHRLGPAGLGVVTRYLAKVMWVRVLGEQWAQGPIQDGELASDVILNPKHGECIRTGRLDELELQLSLGAASVSEESIFTHAAFTPRLIGQPERSGLRRFSAGVVVALPRLRLQLWLVYRFTSAMSTIWPPAVTWLAAGSRYENLETAPAQPLIDSVALRIG